MITAPANPWLRLGRAIIIVYAVLILTIAITGMALFPTYARNHAAEFTPNNAWTSSQVQAGLAQLGWPAIVPAYVEFARTLLMLAVGMLVGLLLLWRGPANWFIMYLAFVFISFSIGEALFNPVLTLVPGMAILGNFLGSNAWQFFFIMLYFFPNGLAVPGWSRWLALTWLGLITFSQVFGEIRFLSGPGIYFALPISAIVSQIYRYFWHSDPLQRQQTKWIFTVVILLLGFIALVASWAFNPPTGPDYRANLIIALANLFMFSVMFALFPLAVAVAVFRYHLWDINLIIRRTFQYSVLTVMLGLIYFGGVLLLQQVFRALTWQESDLALILSTLVIATLFNPLRRRIQTFIDRHFFRNRYDAERILAEFSANLQNEVDVDTLKSLLLARISETVQPEALDLWIRKG